MKNLRDWLLVIAIAMLCLGLAACATEAPTEESGMEAEEPAAEEAAAEGGESEAAEEGEDGDEGEAESEGGE